MQAQSYQRVEPPIKSHSEADILAADGKSDSSAASEAIRAKFATLALNRKARDGFNLEDGKLLKYWAVASPPPVLGSMLADGDGNGQCTAFAQLFRACHQIQGLPGGRIYKLAYPPEGSTELLVREWTVAGGGTTGLLIGVDIIQAPGIVAQGNTEPYSQFDRHFIVQLDGAYFDPSYGRGPFSSQNAHEDNTMAAFSPDLIFANLNVVGVQEVSYTPSDL